MKNTFRFGTTSSRNAGFSLIEVLVALFVLSIGVLGIAGLQVTTKHTNFESLQRTNATFLAQELLERVRANETQMGVYTSAGVGRTIQLEISDGITATDCITTACDPSTIAMHDLYEFSQALQGATELMGTTATGGLVEPTVCISGPATAPGVVSVAIVWRGRTSLSNPTRHACGGSSGRYDDGADSNVLRRLLVVDTYVD